jgi:hypothetical protein
MIPDPALATCHKFSVWHYPWAQRCPTFIRVAVSTPLPPVKGVDIPLPNLSPITGGEPDDIARARLLLHGYLSK